MRSSRDLPDNARDLLTEILGSAEAYIASRRDGQGRAYYAMHATDGTELGTFLTFDEACTTAKHFALTPLTVH